MCFDAKDWQAVAWSTNSTSSSPTSSAIRLGWTQMVGDPETGNVYAHGTQGLLFCFDKDGKILWQHSLTEEYGRITGYGGRVTSPRSWTAICSSCGMINARLGRTGAWADVASSPSTNAPATWSGGPRRLTAP